jgi:Flp pilus assembly protein CpaB
MRMPYRTFLLAVIGTTCWLSSLPAAGLEIVQVVVARKKLFPWTPIKDPARLFEVKRIPRRRVPADAIKSLNDLKGEFVYEALSSGQILRKKNLLAKGPPLPKWARIMRAAVDDYSCGSLKPGKLVDVYATSRDGHKTQLFIAGILVVWVDYPPGRPRKGARIRPTVGFAAGPEECQKLSLADDCCTLHVRDHQKQRESPD